MRFDYDNEGMVWNAASWISVGNICILNLECAVYIYIGNGGQNTDLSQRKVLGNYPKTSVNNDCMLSRCKVVLAIYQIMLH